MENKFRAFKIYVKDEDISKELQKHLFKVGYSWEDYGQNVTFEGMRCLYGSPEGNLAIGYNYLSSFKEHPAKEIGSVFGHQRFLGEGHGQIGADRRSLCHHLAVMHHRRHLAHRIDRQILWRLHAGGIVQ